MSQRDNNGILLWYYYVLFIKRNHVIMRNKETSLNVIISYVMCILCPACRGSDDHRALKINMSLRPDENYAKET